MGDGREKYDWSQCTCPRCGKKFMDNVHWNDDPKKQKCELCEKDWSRRCDLIRYAEERFANDVLKLVETFNREKEEIENKHDSVKGETK